MIDKSLYDGGPAFPVPSGFARNPDGENGMSLRDYFAAKAMAAAMTDGDQFNAIIGQCDKSSDIPIHRQAQHLIAINAYQVADAMLKER